MRDIFSHPYNFEISHPYGMADWGMEFSTDIFVPDGTWGYPSVPQINI
jgi:hypothetical protein